MADNKPALFPITAFIVSYHYARSDGLCVTRVTVYDLFIAAPPSPPHGRNALYTDVCTDVLPRFSPCSLLPLPRSCAQPFRILEGSFHLPACLLAVNTRQIFQFLCFCGNGVDSNGPYVICERNTARMRLFFVLNFRRCSEQTPVTPAS